MKKTAALWRLYGKYFSIHLRSVMEYKASFFFTLAGQFLSSFSAFLSVYFMFYRFHSVEGYAFEEVLLCFSTVMMSFALAECFARGFDSFAGMLGNGEFDRILVRPRGAVFQVLASKVEFTRLGRVVQSLAVFVWALGKCGVVWTAPRVVTLALMLVCGTLLFSGLFLVYAALCFFTTQGLEVLNIFTDGGREFGQYPLSVYGTDVLRVMTFVVPLACVQVYPLSYLLGRAEGLIYQLCPLFALLFLIPSFLLWRFGLRHYRSTGS